MSRKLMIGDCLERMRDIPTGSIDLILTDPPYGTTQCKWDSVIDFKDMWKELSRVIKSNGTILIFGSEPFSSLLRTSNLKMYKYDWVWDKRIPSGMAYARFQPMRRHEFIHVFSPNKPQYFPIKVKREKPIKAGGNSQSQITNRGVEKALKKTYEDKNPTSIIEFMKIRQESVHPTQKPVPLLEYLIKTYTLEKDTVLDFTMGSGSTGVAAKNLNRKFIGIEKDKEYYRIAKQRIEDA